MKSYQWRQFFESCRNDAVFEESAHAGADNARVEGTDTLADRHETA
jgi:hypothetical protein